MNKNKLNDVISELEVALVDLEKIQKVAFMGFDLSTPVYDDDITDMAKGLDALRELPNISTLFNIITDYTDKINQVLEQATNTIHSEVVNGKEN